MAPTYRQRLLVNCSNLHVGGAVAVASSFIDSLSRRPDSGLDISLLLSTSVAANLKSLGTKLGGFTSVQIVDFHGMRALWQGLSAHFAHADIVFTVFGPAYVLHKGKRHVCGFAQPLILYPSNPVERGLPLLARLVQRLKYKLQELFFARADELVVELEHVKRGLERKWLFRSKPIHIVYSTVDAVFRDPARWTPLQMPDRGGEIWLGVISRNYAHKNLASLPALRRELQAKHGLAVEFFVTFTAAEWKACNTEFRRTIHNVGPLMLSQCPSFYTALDGVIFPSLLECFSAVPLEAMLMRKPLFASNLPFICDCCHEHAHYFDPLDIASMANAIARYFQSAHADEKNAALDRAQQFVSRYPSADERAHAYLAIVLGALPPLPQ
jgi:glycosyltransferase involved in cell wall biosynthesis